MDLRKHRSAILSAVAEENAKDRFGWHVYDIDRKEVSIAWSYLKRVGQKENFSFRVYEDSGDCELIGSMHTGYPDDDGMDLIVTVGDYHWCDAKTMDEGIGVMVKRISRLAHARY